MRPCLYCVELQSRRCIVSAIDPVTDYRLWARIEHSGPNEFTAMVTAVPENGDPSLVQTLVEIRSSREAAVELARAMLHRMGGIVRRSEGSVAAVEAEGIQ